MYKAGLAIALFWVVFLTGCAGVPTPQSSLQLQSTALRDVLIHCGNDVDDAEAGFLAEAALVKTEALARQYRAVRPAWLHNVLVNGGLRQRGLCYHWTNDLFAHLLPLGLQSLELHLAAARLDTAKEHNAIVVTARGKPFVEGVVLDAWRHSGRLWWGSVVQDKYPWQPLPRERVPAELEQFFTD